MPAPIGTDPYLKAFLDDLEGRVGVIENPQGPVPSWPVLKAKLPAALRYINCTAFVTDTNILVYSDGTNWRRVDTGAII